MEDTGNRLDKLEERQESLDERLHADEARPVAVGFQDVGKMQSLEASNKTLDTEVCEIVIGVISSQGVTDARLAAFAVLKTLNPGLIDEDVLEAIP